MDCLHLALWSQYLKIKQQKNRKRMSHLFRLPSPNTWLICDMVFTPTFKAEVWVFGEKHSEEGHYGHSQSCPLIDPWCTDACGLLFLVAWASFATNARVATPLGSQWWCCLTLNLIAYSGKPKWFLRQTGSTFDLWPGPNVRVYFVFFWLWLME